MASRRQNLHGLGIVIALLLALQVRKALITRAKVSCYITFVLVDADIIVAETHSYGRAVGSNNVLDRCLQVHIPWEGDHPRGLYKGVYRVPSFTIFGIRRLPYSTASQHLKRP